MKLINDFFQIVISNIKEDEIVASVKMNADHSIYHAHFPGNPITPGVCLVQMSTEILEMGIKRHLHLQHAVKIKFCNPMVPSVEPTFIFQKINISEHSVSVQVIIRDSNVQYAKMTLIYTVTL